MAQKKDEITNLWLYLARRDKKGVRIIATLRSRPQSVVRISDLNVLNLPRTWQTEIFRIIQEDRMLWEPFVESAVDFDALKSNLKKRGYSSKDVFSFAKTYRLSKEW